MKKLKKYGIYAISVAEVDNLFLTEELLTIINTILGHKDNARVDDIKIMSLMNDFQNNSIVKYVRRLWRNKAFIIRSGNIG